MQKLNESREVLKTNENGEEHTAQMPKGNQNLS